jgi:hypothetical protein
MRLPNLSAGRALLPRKNPDTHFCYRLSQPQSDSAAGRIRWIVKTRMTYSGVEQATFPACSIVSQPARLPPWPQILGYNDFKGLEIYRLFCMHYSGFKLKVTGIGFMSAVAHRTLFQVAFYNFCHTVISACIHVRTLWFIQFQLDSNTLSLIIAADRLGKRKLCNWSARISKRMPDIRTDVFRGFSHLFWQMRQ